VGYIVDTHCPEKADPRDWNLSEMATDMIAYFDIDIHAQGLVLDELGVDGLTSAFQDLADAKYDEKHERLGPELMSVFQRDVLLRVVDQSWKDHLLALDHLKEGIGLRAVGQKDPKNEYKRESFELFQAMKERIEDTTIKTIYRVEPMSVEQMKEHRRQQSQRPPSGFQFSAPPKAAAPQSPKTVRGETKVGRNQPCPCGSGKKYKKCHGAPARVGG
jgi:preprotein translocase subunit SecA